MLAGEPSAFMMLLVVSEEVEGEGEGEAKRNETERGSEKSGRTDIGKRQERKPERLTRRRSSFSHSPAGDSGARITPDR